MAVKFDSPSRSKIIKKLNVFPISRVDPLMSYQCVDHVSNGLYISRALLSVVMSKLRQGYKQRMLPRGTVVGV